MDRASQILLVGGMSVLMFGLLLGIPMGLARQKASHAPRYLVLAHLASIIQGGLLLALTVVVGSSALSSGMETLAAAAAVSGSALFGVGNTINWLQKVQDAFSEKSLGNKIGSVGTPLIVIGVGMFLFGALKGL